MAKPSLLDRTEGTRGALLVGCGGGGDIVQTLGVRHYLQRLGVERIVLGEVAVKWWDRPGRVPLGAEVSDLSWYAPGVRLHENAVAVEPSTRLTSGLGEGALLYEAEVARVTELPTVAFGVQGGSVGLTDACRAVMQLYELDLFMTVDIGADAFFTGRETTVQSPLVDSFTINAARALQGCYGLAGYGCDGEMPTRHLEEATARVMADGGYLGAHGLTPRDVAEMSAVLDSFPDEPVEIWPRDAARGRLGTQYCKGWWTIDVTPLAAVVLFFDPDCVARINPILDLVATSMSLAEAEEAILAETVLVPETRLPFLVEVPTGPQLAAPSDGDARDR